MPASVAVIGLGSSHSKDILPRITTDQATGALGLVAVKNLLEEGFDVTGFDRNDYVGGLWRYTEDARTSVLKSMQWKDEVMVARR